MDNNFWNITKALIKERGLTQKEFAESLNISLNTFQGWISKEVLPDVLIAKKIAVKLECSLDYLTGDVEGVKLSSEDAEILKIYHSVPDMYKNVVKSTLNNLAQQFKDFNPS